MAVTRLSNGIEMTATGDAVTGKLFIVGINFQGTGLTAGQRVKVTTTGGATIADYIVEAASDNADLIPGRMGMFYDGVAIASGTVGGVWVLSVVLG